MKAEALTLDTAPEFMERLAKLQPGSPRKWGTLEPAGMVRHMATALAISLGEGADFQDRSNFATRSRLFRWLFVETLPWPKGRIKAPASFTPAPEGDLAAELEHLDKAMRRFGQELASDPSRRTLHPVFGRLPLSYWSRMHALHFGHHFKQFGL